MMSKAHIKRFLTLLSSAKKFEQARLYQLLHQAESCYCLKDRRGQYEFGKALSLFSSPFDVVGDYYQAFYLYKIGEKQTAREKLQRAYEEGEPSLKDKALLTLGAIEESEGNIDEAMQLRLATTKSEFLHISIESTIGVASILGVQGEHQEALKHLERALSHYHKLGNVPLYFDVRNSYAVELAETGKIDLASEVIAPVTASPYALYYPNWIETQQEIEEKSRRSTVTFNSSNVVEFPLNDKVQETSAREPRTFPYSDFVDDEFRVQDKVEDWIYGGTEPDDLGTLMLALYQSRDEAERDMILGRVIDSAFVHTSEARDAKTKWEDKLLAKMKK
jgi:hypothetical protein